MHYSAVRYIADHVGRSNSFKSVLGGSWIHFQFQISGWMILYCFIQNVLSCFIELRVTQQFGQHNYDERSTRRYFYPELKLHVIFKTGVHTVSYIDTQRVSHRSPDRTNLNEMAKFVSKELRSTFVISKLKRHPTSSSYQPSQLAPIIRIIQSIHVCKHLHMLFILKKSSL